MKNIAASLTFSFLILLLVSGCANSPFADDAVTRISKEDLKAQMGEPNLILLDTRTGSDWNNSDQIIQGAKRADPKKFSEWEEVYPKDATIVLY
jgi:hypothetical protein